MELDNPKNLYSKNDLKIEIRHPFQQISKSNSSSGAKNCHWNPKKDTTPEKNSIRKPGTQKSMENCAFFLAIFSAQPGPTNRFLETLHGSSSRFALPFLPSRSCSGWVVFSEISLTTLPFNVFFGGLKELDQLTQKGVWKDGFFPTCRFFFWVWCFDEERANKNRFRLQGGQKWARLTCQIFEIRRLMRDHKLI